MEEFVFQNVGIVGAGGWGMALANQVAANTERPVTLWGFLAEEVEQLRARRENPMFLPGVRLRENVRPTQELAELAGCDLLFFVTPSKGTRAVARRLAAHAPRGVLLSCTKGIEQGSGLRMSEVLRAELPGNRVAVLSGPSHAEEAATGMPTLVVVGCEEARLAVALQRALNAVRFRVYTSSDTAGIELGGALKNVFALAAGVSDGLGFGDNTKAALVTRALVELTRLGTALGGRRETFQGLSGMGDLMVTCFSRHSRNRSVGERMGRGERYETICGSMKMVAEGVPTTLSAYECARRAGVETPIIDAVHGMLYGGKSPAEAVNEILAREPKPEN